MLEYEEIVDGKQEEIFSLNIEELDIEELEHRLELAAGTIHPDGYTCGSDYCGQESTKQT